MTTISRDILMAVAASREIKDGETAFIGTGLPMVAAYLAKATHAPTVNLVFESGIIDPSPIELASGVGEYKLVYGSTKIAGTFYALSLLQQGKIDIGFLGTAEVDAFGNLNSTVIGNYRKPKVRLPGSGGANDIASMAKRFVIIARADPKRFVEKLNYLTTPGFLSGPGAREAAGLPGSGPVKVITDLGILGFDPKTKRMRLEETYPGIDAACVQKAIGFSLESYADTRVATLPTDTQIQLLKTQIDPNGMYIKDA
ncbi:MULTISPECIES: CoA-transferase subunit beta [unclassified Rhizobium]|uniref:CoA-transferase subunit beta n=1 Tax=Rhizobium sp. 16-488-2a TaxID=2819990 RepID=UPI001ADB836C|nr:CoA-transferase [Rhizobium sp. 16-488-2a]MBO9178297.1 3-oxoadipate--succinyl-CoA transferase subunit B [Rhizobium sp. 16-488-2a]